MLRAHREAHTELFVHPTPRKIGQVCIHDTNLGGVEAHAALQHYVDLLAVLTAPRQLHDVCLHASHSAHFSDYRAGFACNSAQSVQQSTGLSHLCVDVIDIGQEHAHDALLQAGHLASHITMFGTPLAAWH